MRKAGLNQPRRRLSSLRCPTADQPWWADAHCFLPLLLGPLAFLATVVPGLGPVLWGQSIDCAGLLSEALVRLVVFAGLGYVSGLGVHWMHRLASVGRAARVDVTVGGRAKASNAKPSLAKPVAVWVTVEHVEPGMKLAAPLASPDGRSLAAEGAILTGAMIEAAKNAGVSRLAVEGVKYSVAEKQSGGDV